MISTDYTHTRQSTAPITIIETNSLLCQGLPPETQLAANMQMHGTSRHNFTARVDVQKRSQYAHQHTAHRMHEVHARHGSPNGARLDASEIMEDAMVASPLQASSGNATHG